MPTVSPRCQVGRTQKARGVGFLSSGEERSEQEQYRKKVFHGLDCFLRVSPSGRGSEMRARLMTAPVTAKPPASSSAVWVLFSGTMWNSRAISAAPVVCPMRRAVASMPLADPLRSGGAEAIRMLLLGDWKSPNPAPQSTSRPDDVEIGRMLRKERQQEQPRGHRREARAAEYAGVNALDEHACRRGDDHDYRGQAVSSSPVCTSS